MDTIYIVGLILFILWIVGLLLFSYCEGQLSNQSGWKDFWACFVASGILTFITSTIIWIAVGIFNSSDPSTWENKLIPIKEFQVVTNPDKTIHLWKDEKEYYSLTNKELVAWYSNESRDSIEMALLEQKYRRSGPNLTKRNLWFVPKSNVESTNK